ncbi:MAG: hypothetical protein N2445_01330 [Acidobacteria bacterium]|nr:hypothetical protein [Acidobacteriota bacterium]
MAITFPALIELHLHLEGSIYPSDALFLCRKNNIKFNKGTFRHSNFEDFLKHFGEAVSLLKDKEDLAFILQNHLKRLNKWGVVYAEIRISPSVWEFCGLNPEKTADLLFSLNFNDLMVNFIVESVRHWDKKLLERDFDLALKHKDKVKAFGIGGNEMVAPIENFKFLFEECSKKGITFIPHCGEVSDSNEVLKAVDFGAKRIGHGIKSIESKNVIEKLKDSKVHLEICPTSNYMTGAIEYGEPHPLKHFYEKGVNFSVSTDDPGLFLTTLKKELFLAQQFLSNKNGALIKMQKEALKASLLNKKEKERLMNNYYI